MAYDTILFDMDGVLLTGYHTARSVYRQAVAATLADFGLDPQEEVPEGLVKPESVGGVRETCEALSVPADPVWAYRERAATTIENESIVAGERTPFGDTDVLGRLDAECDLGIVSNNRQGTARFAAAHFGWPMAAVRGRFPTLAEYERLKPDPMLLSWTLDRLDKSEALFVGDRYSDVEAAHNAGIDAALLSRNGDPEAGNPEPEHHITSLSELPDVLE